MRTISYHNSQATLARALDFLCLLVAYATICTVVSGLARVHMFIWPSPGRSDILGWPAQYIVLLFIAVIMWQAVGAYCGLYRNDDELASSKSLNGLAQGLVGWMASLGVSIFIFKLPNVSRMFVFSFASLGSVLLVCRAFLQRRLARRYNAEQPRVALVIGSDKQVEWLIKYLRRTFLPRPYLEVRRLTKGDLGRLHSNSNGHANGDFEMDPPSQAIEAFVTTADISGDTSQLVTQLLMRGIKTHIIPMVLDASIFRMTLTDMGGVPVITLQSGELDVLEIAVKRVLDFVGATLSLIICAPLLMLVALSVKLSSPGKVLFRQKRLGKHGREFYIYKFRTMREGADSDLKSDQQMYAEYRKNNYKLPKGKDPRITPLGGLLRRTSLDELPQLINVLKGEMSLVGPRPVVPEEIEEYGEFARLLLSIQPGMTGEWQVSGRSEIADYARRVRLDMEYVRDQSIATDVRILLRTLPAVLSRYGAY